MSTWGAAGATRAEFCNNSIHDVRSIDCDNRGSFAPPLPVADGSFVWTPSAGEKEQDMILALIIALPFLGALLPLIAERCGRTACAAATGLVPLAGLALLLSQRGTVFAGLTLTAGLSLGVVAGAGHEPQPAPGRPGLPLRPADPRHRPAGDPLRPLLPLGEGADGAFLRLPAAVHGRHARRGARGKPAVDDALLGTDQPVLVPADRLLGAVARMRARARGWRWRSPAAAAWRCWPACC